MLAPRTAARLVAKRNLVERDADRRCHPQRLALSIVAGHGLTLGASPTASGRGLVALYTPEPAARRASRSWMPMARSQASAGTALGHGA